MMMDFKSLAKLCVDAEMNHITNGKSGEPMAQIGISGDQTKGTCIHILTAPQGHSALTGKPNKYVKQHDLTIVDIACRDIRAFYHNMNWSIEEFIDEISKVLH
jgi:hypothetical protein